MKSLLSIVPLLFSIGVFTGCQQQARENRSKEPVEVRTDYMSQGKEIAARTFGVLSATLQKAIQDEGVPGAISLCNLEAYPLVDSLSETFDVQIRRTSFKTRNPRNNPTGKEVPVLEEYQRMHQQGLETKPVVKTLQDGTHAFYAPIKVNDFCLKCHGKIGTTLDPEHYDLIRELYPNDKAIDYKAGDLRGMWSITFKD